MIDTCAELRRLINEFELTHRDVARRLDVSVVTVLTWVDGNNPGESLPESLLRLLEYDLMSRNTQSIF
ncbi:hypothetical protein [Thiohalorhabdus methylotrophus]|uniref:Uncharacterized protein n=1 Tax=Thiohalorhabdus methylotrophus TaxID=3242694 RepID=A0ABV4TTU6_9GAMM